MCFFVFFVLFCVFLSLSVFFCVFLCFSVFLCKLVRFSSRGGLVILFFLNGLLISLVDMVDDV
jgi:hypothetical protein